MKWVPKDPDGTIGVPGKGFIKSADFTDEDLVNLITRAKNRKVDVNTFLLNAKLVPTSEQFELPLEELEELEEKKEPVKKASKKKAETPSGE
jgi:hypothetical protein